MKAPPQGVLAEPVGQSPVRIYAAFEGWGPLKDGVDDALLLGYFNRNRTQELDIPIGPDNSIEPGGPDYGQPTHFLTGRQYGMFAVVVPKDFGTKKFTWTITANGQKTSVQFWLNPAYWVDFFKHAASENEPPRIKFAMDGPEYTGTTDSEDGCDVERHRWPAARSYGVGRRSTGDTRVRYDTDRR